MFKFSRFSISSIRSRMRSAAAALMLAGCLMSFAAPAFALGIGGNPLIDLSPWYLIVGGTIVVLWFLFLSLFLKRFKVVDPDAYENLSFPDDIFDRSSTSNPLQIVWFLITRRHRQLDDGRLSMLGDIAALLLVISIIGFISISIDYSTQMWKISHYGS